MKNTILRNTVITILLWLLISVVLSSNRANFFNDNGSGFIGLSIILVIALAALFCLGVSVLMERVAFLRDKPYLGFLIPTALLLALMH